MFCNSLLLSYLLKAQTTVKPSFFLNLFVKTRTLWGQHCVQLQLPAPWVVPCFIFRNPLLFHIVLSTQHMWGRVKGLQIHRVQLEASTVQEFRESLRYFPRLCPHVRHRGVFCFFPHDLYETPWPWPVTSPTHFQAGEVLVQSGKTTRRVTPGVNHKLYFTPWKTRSAHVEHTERQFYLTHSNICICYNTWHQVLTADLISSVTSCCCGTVCRQSTL